MVREGLENTAMKSGFFVNQEVSEDSSKHGENSRFWDNQKIQRQLTVSPKVTNPNPLTFYFGLGLDCRMPPKDQIVDHLFQVSTELLLYLQSYGFFIEIWVCMTQTVKWISTAYQRTKPKKF